VLKLQAFDPVHRRNADAGLVALFGGIALNRRAATAVPKSALVWYSGESKGTGRGAVMVYIPVADSYWPWYAALETGEPWCITETWDIKREDLAGLIKQGLDTDQL